MFCLLVVLLLAELGNGLISLVAEAPFKSANIFHECVVLGGQSPVSLKLFRSPGHLAFHSLPRLSFLRICHRCKEVPCSLPRRAIPSMSQKIILRGCC